MEGGIPRRPLGRTGHRVSILGLGGVNYHELPDAAAAAVVHRAIDLGINLIDTAVSYGNGESERKIGLVMAERRREVFLTTKTAQRTRDGALADFEGSLRRLQCDQVDLLFVHSIENEADRQAILRRPSVLDAAEELRAAGKIRFIGLSGHSDREAMLACLKEYPFDAVLCPVSAANGVRYSFEETVLPYAREHGLARIGMKIMHSTKAAEIGDPGRCLRYSLNLPIDCGIVGVDNCEQLERNVALVKAGLPPLEGEERAAFLAQARAATESFGEGQWSWMPNEAKG
ncbi:MAG: aldo/keto reductase [Armatimonadetes bacterium]|nr:aldo/keto reductase [Armatimonadota bacterium]